MGVAAEFDIGPLTWVKGEIEQSLAKAGGALAAYLADSSASTQIKFCKTHLHQAHGALEIVGLSGVTRLTEECERVLDNAESGAAALDAARGAALAQVFAALPVYLNELVDGAPHQPVRLFPAYRAIMQARGAERIAESDLFFPDLSAWPPQREAPAPPADMREHVMAQRRRFQSGLLRWLRNPGDAAALRDMGEAVRAIERTQALPQHRAFWWITIGFTETLQDTGGGVEIDAKRLCARIDMQMKRLMEGSQNVAQRLMRDALYFVAKSRAGGAAVKELHQFYRLERVVPNALAPAAGAHPHEASLRAIREILVAAKDKWNKFSAGQTHELAGFRDQAAQLKEKTAALGHVEFARLVNAISVVTLWVAENPAKVTEPVAIETATALLLAENAVDNFARLGAEFEAQVAAMGARLKASLAGQTAAAHAVPLLDQMSRRAQERLLMAQVVLEIKSNLGGIETALDAFFRDAAQRDQLPAMDRQIRQVLGAFTILGSDRAVVALKACQGDIARFGDTSYVPDQGDFERVANTLSALGFFVDALKHGPADFDAVVRPAGVRGAVSPMAADDRLALFAGAPGTGDAAQGLTVAAMAGTADASLEGTVEAELEQEKNDARTLFDAWCQQPADTLLTAELQASLEAIKNDADLVDDPTLRLHVTDLLAAMQSIDPAHMGMLEQTMSRIAPPVPAATVAAVPAAPAPAAAASPAAALPDRDEAVDAELLGIFLEEAAEVLDTVGQQHALALAVPGNQEILITIRRAFHTLKGSGRMVGLMRFAEAAWAVEQTISQWQQEEKPASADLLALIRAGGQLFGRWVADLTATGASPVDALPLIAAAARVQAGLPFDAAAETAVAAPAVVPAVVPTVVPSVAPPAVPAPAVSPAAVAAPVLADQTIMIGDIRLGRGIYTIFVDEAGGHLAAMESELGLLEAEPQPPRDELVRAAHTLGGIAGTVNFKKLHELARAFERMLLAAQGGAIALAAPDLELARESVAALTAMVAAVRELRPPAAADALQLELENRRAVWAAASDSETSDPELSGFALPAAQIPVASTSAFDAGSAQGTAGVGANGKGGEAEAAGIDFSAWTLPFGSPPAVSAAAVPEPGFSLNIESLTAPAAPAASAVPTTPAELAAPAAPAAPAVATVPSFLDAIVPATPPLATEAASPVPAASRSLGEQTIQMAASSALAAVALARAASPAAPDLPLDGSGMPSDEQLQARGFDTSDRRQERIDDEIDDQLLPIFLEEANELMPRISAELRSWADGGSAQELQRALHTLKGSARMAGAMALGQLTHSMETRVENALQLPHIPPPIFEGLFSSFDRTALLFETLKQAGPDGLARAVEAGRAATVEDDASALVRVFDAAAPAAAPVPAPLADSAASAAAPATAAAKAAEEARAVLRVRADVIDRLVNEAGEVATARSRIEGEMRAVKSSLKDLTENLIRLRGQLREIEIAAESQMQSRQREVEQKHGSFDPLEFDRFSRFQEITRMMAESVNDVATVQQNLLRNVDEADAALLAQGRLSRELQNDLMRVRMVPFNNVAERLYRVVRQTAKELGKRANLDIKGTQTEIDRSVLERMTGPFEHLLRNAIAHGLEEPQGRVAAGKSDIGQISLLARQEGNEFVLVFEDDGRGLDIARIRAKALLNGLMQPGDALTDVQIAEFIFAPGFSTAAQVSEVSGRGVGMDVVRTEVAALGGRVEIDFTAGKGSRFTIYLPLTLAVIQVVLIRTGDRVYAVPSAMVEQVRQIKVDELDRARTAGKVEWLGREYPLHFLPRLLGNAAQVAETQRFTPVLLLRSGTLRAAIQVDELLGNQEVVVKNIGPQLARVAGMAGATVLGTGQIVLILNPVPLAAQQAAVPLAAAAQASVSTASLAVPLSAASSVPASPAAAALSVPAQPVVMVVDDSLTVRKITSRLLTRENYQVVTAKDGIDALEQLQDLRPDVMLVDVEMPRMDGFDLTRNVRGDAKLKNIPVIMITSRTADKHRQYAMEIGVNVFLGKPYQEEELLAQIDYLVKSRVGAAGAA